MEVEIEEVDLEQGSASKIEEFGLEQNQKVEDLKGANDRLMSRLHKKLEALPEKGEQRCTIFRVPENIRKSKPHLFEPSAVSIGPYHRDKEHLRAIEEMKWPLLRDFIAKAVDTFLETCITEIRALEAQARECYNETIHMDSDAFIEMMLLDGSFIIQFILGEGIARNTIYKDAGWKNAIISYDLIMIENQIPFFILEKMFSCLNGHGFTSENLKMIVGVLAPEGLLSISSPMIATPSKEIYHLLHLCYHYIVPTNKGDETQIHSQLCPSWIPRPKKFIKTCPNLKNNFEVKPSGSAVSSQDETIVQSSGELPKMAAAKIRQKKPPCVDDSRPVVWSLPCATELQEAGVKIKKKKNPCHFSDVTFQSGILEIPALTIDDMVSVVMMNLVALEQALSDVPERITTYNWFMDGIMNTANDVTILERLKIIDNMIASEEAVALYFNQSSQYVEIDKDHYLAKSFKDIKEYCDKTWHRNRAKLMRDYFSNPWSMLSLGAAIFIILLTCTQTIYAIFAYHLPPH